MTRAGGADTRHRDAVVEILAILMRLPGCDRLDTFAVAIRAALDSGLLDGYGRREVFP